MLALGYLASPAAFAPAYPAARAVAHRRHEPAQAIFGAAPDDDALSMQYAVDVPYKEAAYDPQAADAFYRARPAAVVRRVAQLAQLSGGFVLATLLDKKLDREEQMAEQRSEELLQLVTKLGPALYARAGPPNRTLPNADNSRTSRAPQHQAWPGALDSAGPRPCRVRVRPHEATGLGQAVFELARARGDRVGARREA